LTLYKITRTVAVNIDGSSDMRWGIMTGVTMASLDITDPEKSDIKLVAESAKYNRSFDS